MRFARVVAVAVAVAWMAASADPAIAFVCKFSKVHNYVSLHWADRDIPYGIRRGTTTQPGVGKVVASAFAQWSAQPCTDIRFIARGENGFVDANLDVSQVIFISQGWRDRPSEGDKPRSSDIVALTLTTYRVETGVIRKANIEVNEEDFELVDVDPLLNSGECDPATRPKTMDLGAVLTHEVGHLLGLDHTQEANVTPGGDNPTMAAYVGACEAEKRSLHDDDVAGLCYLYPAGGKVGFCASLPAQTDSYVRSVPFGCAASRSRSLGSGPGVSGAIGLLLVLWIRRSLSCPPAKSR